MEKRYRDIVCIDKCRYEIQEQNEIPEWYTGIYRPISSTGNILILVFWVDTGGLPSKYQYFRQTYFLHLQV
jgi:hypothetical protein